MATAGTGDDRSDFISVAEAARILRTSPATIKRRIKAGTLEAELFGLAQGFEYRVRVQRDVLASAGDEAGPSTDRSDPARPAPSTGTMQYVSAAIVAATAPLIADLAASRQANQHLVDQLLEQAETIGQLRAENAALRASQRPQEGDLAASAPDASTDPAAAPGAADTTVSGTPVEVRPWWRRWLIAVFG